MPEVSFYLLSTQSIQERFLYSCRLIEKAYRCEQFCYVYTDTQQQSQQLDNQLWGFRPLSFIPHQIYDGTTPDYQKTVLIGTQSAPENWKKIIVNLSSKYLDDIKHTDRILEVLDSNKDVKQAGRQRYRQYQQAGLKITTHNV
jgi:DNA polymerase-3 subunit chi